MKFRWIVIVLFVACGIAWPNLIVVYEITPSQLSGIDRQVIADAIGSATANDRYPQSVEITTQGKSYPVILEYAIDERIQEEVFSLFANYHPDYAAYVAIDSQTGKVIAMASYSNSDKEVGNLAIRTTFPAASVFKIVTAAAAVVVVVIWIGVRHEVVPPDEVGDPCHRVIERGPVVVGGKVDEVMNYRKRPQDV